jgi:hypothetical protein
MLDSNSFHFQRIHIDAARNSTDDFNPFHDFHRCGGIRGNPYQGVIALGFQLECLIDHLVERRREDAGESRFAEEHGLRFSHYQFTFADALRCGEPFQVEIKPTLRKADPPSLSNRIVLRKDGHPALIGQRRDDGEPVGRPAGLDGLGDLRGAPDRGYLPGTPFFLKRKFLNTSNAKNFLVGSLVDQAYYFDEIEERVRFPNLYPCSLVSCALLEKARLAGHDFMKNPMVYASHKIAVDRGLTGELRSNDVLHLLAEGPEREAEAGRRHPAAERCRCHCLTRRNQLLFSAEILLTPLAAILGDSGGQAPGRGGIGG